MQILRCLIIILKALGSGSMSRFPGRVQLNTDFWERAINDQVTWNLPGNREVPMCHSGNSVIFHVGYPQKHWIP